MAAAIVLCRIEASHYYHHPISRLAQIIF
jgi:hypothetical protein